MFYVGSTLDLEQRVKSHKHNKRNRFPFQLLILEERDLLDYTSGILWEEYYWMQQMRSWGFNIRNTYFGEKLPRKKYKFELINGKRKMTLLT